MDIMRTESDSLGQINLPREALYGIHSYRAKNNFTNNTPFPIEWYKAVNIVKLAYYLTYKDFKSKAKDRLSKIQNIKIDFDDKIIDVLIESAKEASVGEYFDSFIVPGIQGGAGTSINMNINEIIANVALKKLGKNAGDYDFINPLDHSNMFQSTNDVIPSSLKVAIIYLLNELEKSINYLRSKIESLEQKYRKVPRIAYTQFQAAVPSSYGLLFSAYNETLSRDWWRVSKCFERIKMLNIGASAVGTGISVPRYFIMNVIQKLQELTSLPLTRSENLSDATQNLDTLVEVHSILKANAVNLEKISSDIRLLASDLLNQNIVRIPKLQAGSSIMPGKVNPVAVEYTVSISQIIYSNDILISNLSGMGNLDLNPYLPLIGIKFIESLKLLISANNSLADNLFSGLEIDIDKANINFIKNPSITTLLNTYIGYINSEKIAIEMKESQTDIITANEKLKLIDEDKLKNLIKIENFLKLGFSLNDLEN